MKIDKIEVIPVSVPYKHDEISSRVSRSGITEIIVKNAVNPKTPANEDMNINFFE